MALQPKLVVADEPVSALDVSIQAQVINLLKELQTEFGLTYLFIAHDLAMVRYLSDRIGVMKNGRLVEMADSDELYNHAFHPYTQSLLSAVLTPDPRLERYRERMHYDESAWEAEDAAASLMEIKPGHWVRCTEKMYARYRQSLE
ncbi:Oligopeptide transport ATP-binding protein AppF [Lentibacillus sp. JNUCC-1]|nr:Oligopeptide transport ATP-binding protein AppF [Lentibacillus sp. JNUCC-1]